ncbi:MAG: hypothetical protein IKG15_05145 [Solobacterium sp.]|jgi:lysophospholipase L1-like esterase|nr:hypothetical protein [Solobacterium sp.]
MKTVFCIGDSNTWGYTDTACYNGRYPAGVRWTSLIREEGFRVIDDGINGRMIPGEAESAEIAERVSGYSPCTVIIMLGTNDVIGGMSAAACGCKMDILIRTLKKDSGNTLILTAPVPVENGSWGAGKEAIRQSGLLPEIYAAIAENNGILLADAAHWGITVGPDGVHFDEKSHSVFARKMLKILKTAAETV